MLSRSVVSSRRCSLYIGQAVMGLVHVSDVTPFSKLPLVDGWLGKVKHKTALWLVEAKLLVGTHSLPSLYCTAAIGWSRIASLTTSQALRFRDWRCCFVIVQSLSLFREALVVTIRLPLVVQITERQVIRLRYVTSHVGRLV